MSVLSFGARLGGRRRVRRGARQPALCALAGVLLVCSGAPVGAGQRCRALLALAAGGAARRRRARGASERSWRARARRARQPAALRRHGRRHELAGAARRRARLPGRAARARLRAAVASPGRSRPGSLPSRRARPRRSRALHRRPRRDRAAPERGAAESLAGRGPAPRRGERRRLRRRGRGSARGRWRGSIDQARAFVRAAHPGHVRAPRRAARPRARARRSRPGRRRRRGLSQGGALAPPGRERHAPGVRRRGGACGRCRSCWCASSALAVRIDVRAHRERDRRAALACCTPTSPAAAARPGAPPSCSAPCSAREPLDRRPSAEPQHGRRALHRRAVRSAGRCSTSRSCSAPPQRRGCSGSGRS